LSIDNTVDEDVHIDYGDIPDDRPENVAETDNPTAAATPRPVTSGFDHDEFRTLGKI
jgi:hypothetical protein